MFLLHLYFFFFFFLLLLFLLLLLIFLLFLPFLIFFFNAQDKYYLSKWKRGLLATGGCCKEGMTRRNGGNGVLYDPSQEGAPSESLKGQKEKKTHLQWAEMSVTLSRQKDIRRVWLVASSSHPDGWLRTQSPSLWQWPRNGVSMHPASLLLLRKNSEGFTNLHVIIAQEPCSSSLYSKVSVYATKASAMFFLLRNFYQVLC